MFSVPRAASRTRGGRALGRAGVAPGPHGGSPLDLAPLGVRVGPQQLDRLPGGRLGERVHADDRPLARLDRVPSSGTRRPRSRPAPSPASIAATAPPSSSIRSISSQRACLELVGERLDVVRAAERVGGRRRPRLGGEHLLRADRDRRRALGRQRERLVERVRVQRLRAAAYRRQRLDRDADDVVLGLLRRERRAARLRVEAQRQRLRVGRAEALGHHARPQPARRAELRHLLEEVVVRVEEERQPRAELVGREARARPPPRSRRSRSRA